MRSETYKDNSYNIGAKYEIIGRVQHGTQVVAYKIKDRTDESESLINKAIVEELALNKQIYNCKAQVYNNIVNLKGISCKLNQLPRYNEDGTPIEEDNTVKKKVEADLTLIGKVQSGRIVSDYVLAPISDFSKKMKVPKDLVLQLAQDGRIINAKVQMNNGKPILRGTNGISLTQLALYH